MNELDLKFNQINSKIDLVVLQLLSIGGAIKMIKPLNCYSVAVFLIYSHYLHVANKVNQYGKNVSKVRAHDAIVGVLYLISAGFTLYTSNLNFV